ncbi:MAG: rod shape-determining protein MreD [Nitrosomonadales bacterium]|nr:rod shape-determining protein MreD [Nitrosomonadales bacterium]
MSNFPKDQEFLLPASNLFIALSLVAALLLNWLPWQGIWLALRPDFVALVLLYWCTHKPYRLGIGIAWGVGIFADVANASVFGQHALAYTVLAFGGVVLYRRVQMFDLRQQTLQIFPIMLLTYVTYAVVHWQLHGYIAWSYFIGCLTSTALWIPLTLLLQTLRHPRSDPDRL